MVRATAQHTPKSRGMVGIDKQYEIIKFVTRSYLFVYNISYRCHKLAGTQMQYCGDARKEGLQVLSRFTTRPRVRIR